MFKILFILVWSVSNAYCLELSEIQKLALENSPTLKAEELEERALRSELNVAGAWQNPQLMGQIGEIKNDGKSAPTIEVSVTQVVPLTKKNQLKKNISEFALEGQKTQTNYFKLWVTHQTTLAAWRAYVNNELYLHSSERIRRFALIKKYLETSPKISVKQKVELSIINSQLIQLEKDLDLKKYNQQKSINDLAFWTGRTLKADDLLLKLPNSIGHKSETSFDEKRNIQLQQSKLHLAKLESEVELAKKEKMPDLYLGAGYREENLAPSNQFSYAIIGLNIPIWDTGSSRVEAAKAREMKERALLNLMEREIENLRKNQFVQLKMAEKQVDRFSKDLIQKTEQNVIEAEKGFKVGVLDVNTFLQAETQAHEIVDTVYLSWMDYLENLSTYSLISSDELIWETK